MNLIIFGPPGAGKGTQSAKIIKDFNLKQISTGDILRNEIKLNTVIGKKIESLMDKGELVHDIVVDKLIEKVVSKKQNHSRLIFDGYPRTLSQINSLENILKKNNQKISIILSLKINKDTVVRRVSDRVICTKCLKIFNIYYNPPNNRNHSCDKKHLKKRSDDNPETIINRFENYVFKTKPILDYYKSKIPFYEIDGNLEIDEIYSKIKGILVNI